MALKRHLQEGFPARGSKLSPPVREEQSLPLNDDNHNNATNHLENEQPSEAEAANSKGTPTDISEESQLSEEIPLENTS